MEISAIQSVRIFGWWAQPRLTLGWEDIKTTAKTWRELRALGIGAADLKRLQPDKLEWIQRGGVRLDDLRDMSVFPVNPIEDFRADLAELWRLAPTAAELHGMHVDYPQMLKRGLTPQIMFYFAFQLSDWQLLGLRESHVSTWSERDCKTVFGIGKNETCKILADFTVTE